MFVAIDIFFESKFKVAILPSMTCDDFLFRDETFINAPVCKILHENKENSQFKNKIHEKWISQQVHDGMPANQKSCIFGI